MVKEEFLIVKLLMMIGMPPSITNSPAVVRNIIQSILVAIIVKENVHNRKKFVTKGSLFFLPLFEKKITFGVIFFTCYITRI